MKNFFIITGIFLIIIVCFKLLSSHQNKITKSATTAKNQLKSQWFYPMTKYGTRAILKKFGQFIDEKFYAGREELFPTQYFGYHSGVDLEVSPKESTSSVEVSIYAITSGKIVFVGEVAGYGGVILEKLDGTNHVALYGHVRIYSQDENSKVVVQEGEKVQAGQKITVLGDAFSAETGGERKHLHFGIHRGTDLYFLGHEETKEDLNLNWVDPTKFLKEKGAGEQK